MKNEIIEKDYFIDLNKIKETIKQNQNKAMVYVNSQMILTYYQIGTIINERKTWGSKYIENLANDLKEYGKGYSSRNLRYMSKIASEYSAEEILQQPAAQIHWHSLVEITIKSKSHEEMLWYINAVDDLERTDGDNETIGLLLCKDADNYVAKTSLNKSTLKLGISKYKIIEELPEYLEKRLKESEKY